MRCIIFILFVSFSQQLLSQDLNFKIYTEKVEDTYEIYADNLEFSPVSISFIFTLDNLESTLANEQIVVIPSEIKHFRIAKLSRKEFYLKASFQYKSSFILGNATQTKYDENFLYTLPFEIGKTSRIYQGYDGDFSHKNQKALDFEMKIGDKIYAARGGKIININTKSDKNCEEISCAKYNNEIVILHSDGTFAEYLHLMKDGENVQIGEEVKQGQYIGRSGNTGFTKGPHLHFSVFKNKMDGQRMYIATKFKIGNDTSKILEYKISYSR